MAEEELVRSTQQSITRLARFVNQLMREQLAGCPVTVQQCYTLEALVDGPRSMNALAAEVALHQSTLTRIVEKLEKQDLVRRSRPADNQRSVQVEITESGKLTHAQLDRQCGTLISDMLDLVPDRHRRDVVRSLKVLATLLDPRREAFQILKNCCGRDRGDIQT